MNRIKFFSVCMTFIGSSLMFAQQQSNNEVFLKPAPISYLDSIKKTFVNYDTSNCIDERWMNELTNQDLFSDMFNDVTKIDIDKTVDFNLSSDLLKKRLKMLNQRSPFNIEYNQALENVIKSFLKNRTKSFERLMALSEYYFPMFEEHLSKYNLPLEIKYLAIVESALNPHAKSHVGASGLWQFMYATGKQYNLEVNSYVDERYDPLKATDAACQYFTNMYKIFGDWDLVLASYNTGPGNVSKAIRRSGGYTNYWNIRPYLHKETQGYLPAFLATMYIYEFHKDHGIKPKKAPLTYFETDTVMVKRKMSFDQISDLLDIPVNQIKFLNPIYKVQVIPYVEEKAHFLRLPKDKLSVFQSNENKIYAYVDYMENKREKPFERNRATASTNDGESETKVVTKTTIHKVKKGEVMSTIASKNGVSIAEIKRWNNLKSNTVRVGQNIKIQKTSRITVTKPKVKTSSTLNDSLEVENKEKVVDALTKTALATQTKIEPLDTKKESNESKKIESKKPEIKPTKLAEETKVIEKVDEKKAEAKQVVQQAKEEVKTEDKTEVKTPIVAKPKVEKKVAEVKQITHTIKSGESLEAIAAKYKVSIADVKTWNNMKSDKIMAGKTLVIKSDSTSKDISKNTANESKSKNQTYVVQEGDTLYKIANKTGLSIDQIKKVNNLNSEVLKPGQVLKING